MALFSCRVCCKELFIDIEMPIDLPKAINFCRSVCDTLLLMVSVCIRLFFGGTTAANDAAKVRNNL